jgi:hypothetical protein
MTPPGESRAGDVEQARTALVEGRESKVVSLQRTRKCKRTGRALSNTRPVLTPSHRVDHGRG